MWGRCVAPSPALGQLGLGHPRTRSYCHSPPLLPFSPPPLLPSSTPPPSTPPLLLSVSKLGSVTIAHNPGPVFTVSRPALTPAAIPAPPPLSSPSLPSHPLLSPPLTVLVLPPVLPLPVPSPSPPLSPPSPPLLTSLGRSSEEASAPEGCPTRRPSS